MKKLITLLVAGAFALACSATANANLITNGSFEDTTVNAHSGKWGYFSQSAVDGWNTKKHNSIEIQTASLFGPAADGNQYVELDSKRNDSNKWLYQKFATIAGQTYNYSFAFSARQGHKQNDLRFEIKSNSLWLAGGTLSANGSNLTGTSWEYYSGSFVATSSWANIRFKDAGRDDSYGTFIDDVNVAPVPEPRTMFLFGAGLIGLAGAARRKKK